GRTTALCTDVTVRARHRLPGLRRLTGLLCGLLSLRRGRLLGGLLKGLRCLLHRLLGARHLAPRQLVLRLIHLILRLLKRLARLRTRLLTGLTGHLLAGLLRLLGGTL